MNNNNLSRNIRILLIYIFREIMTYNLEFICHMCQCFFINLITCPLFIHMFYFTFIHLSYVHLFSILLKH